MILFKRKKPEERPQTDIHEIKNAVKEGEFTQPISITPKIKETIESKPMPKEEEKSKFAPLFVKINRYNSILNLLNDLKATTMMVKNALVVQKEIERLAEENRKMIEDGANKIDNKLIILDSEFIKPKGFKDEFKNEKKSDLTGIVDTLKSQVDDLKSELENIS